MLLVVVVVVAVRLLLLLLLLLVAQQLVQVGCELLEEGTQAQQLLDAHLW